MKISELEPQYIWNYFDEILKVPRPSKKEGKIIVYLKEFASARKLSFKQDEIGNILISKPATIGFEKRKTIILQSHIDMVCEKNEETIHNFETDPINAFVEDGWIKAKGTTLGADNGIGIAAQLAVLSDATLQHGPIECLFTVDEETGLTGANHLQAGFINGSILLNLDSEDDGIVYIGCAGGATTIARLPYKINLIKKESVAFSIKIKGLKGGHSGDDINKGLGNSIKLMARFLGQASKKFKLQLSSFQGGNLHNAIPREAVAEVTISTELVPDFMNYIKTFDSDLKKEFYHAEPKLLLEAEPKELPAAVFNKKSQRRLINALNACPNGVIAMSLEIPGLVETSTNLAAVKMKDEEVIEIITSQRSSLGTAKIAVAWQIESLFKLAKAKVETTDAYPGWTPNTQSQILQITEQVHQDIFGEKPKIKAIHAGLECGLFLKKYPGLDMVSFGPTILGAHSPDERLEIKTVERFWKLLTGVLQNAPENQA